MSEMREVIETADINELLSQWESIAECLIRLGQPGPLGFDEFILDRGRTYEVCAKQMRDLLKRVSRYAPIKP